LIVECLNHEVTYLNLIAMFLTISGRVGDKDVDSVELFMEMFGGVGMPIILCITHADEFNATKMKSIEIEIQEDPRLVKFFQSGNLRIMFMGCVDHKHNDYYDINVIAQKYKMVTDWRTAFIDMIFQSNDRFDLKNTKIFSNRRLNLMQMTDDCIEEINHLTKLDFGGSEYKRRIVLHNANMEYLYNNKMILDADGSEESKIKTENLWNKIQEVKKSKYDDDIKQELDEESDFENDNNNEDD